MAESQIERIMNGLKCSREEAEQLWLDDQEDFIGEEGEQMTQKAKEIRRYEQSDVKKERKPKARKVDEDKYFILSKTKTLLEEFGLIDISMKTETELNFQYNGADYTFKLTKHKKK